MSKVGPRASKSTEGLSHRAAEITARDGQSPADKKKESDYIKVAHTSTSGWANSQVQWVTGQAAGIDVPAFPGEGYC